MAQKKIEKIKKIGISLSVSILIFIASAIPLFAATLNFGVSSVSTSVGETFILSVNVSTDQAINAVSGTISFPSDKLQVISIAKANSIVSLWAEEPSFSNGAGTVSFAGVIPNPGYTGNSGRVIFITFRSIAEGPAQVRFQTASALANDGNGTDILRSSGESNISIGPAQAQAPVTPTESPTKKTTKPIESKPNAETAPASSTPLSTVIVQKIEYIEAKTNLSLEVLIVILAAVLILLGYIIARIYPKLRGIRKRARKDISQVESEIKKDFAHIKKDLTGLTREEAQKLKEDLEVTEKVIKKELEDIVDDLGE
jgi:hypothetical protein